MYREVNYLRPFDPNSWPGRNRFFCNSKFVTGPKEDCIAALVAHLSLAGLSIGFLVCEAPYYFTQVSPIIPIVFTFLFLFSWTLLFLAEFTDPGILLKGSPFNPIPPDPNKELSAKPQAEWYTYRWCHTCYIWRPPRSSHCRVCDSCVQGFDHHCSFINNCVGERNAKYFVGFLWVTSVLTLYCTICSILYFVLIIIDNPEILHRALNYYWMLICSGVFILIGVIFQFIMAYRQGYAFTLCGIGMSFLFGLGVISVGFQDIYVNPLPLLILPGAAGYFLWVTGMSCMYLGLVYQGFTLKESVTVYLSKSSLNGECKNFWKFLVKKPPPSELNQTNDNLIIM